ncbi:uncharacterized protein RCO7_04702 [Rhynchosporium graminicola]|uniref:Heterokaryon incompatibility domain-containing protein n=1 Tax=Rhynchosporium graminicola TaxID=2792576 RepID=A0A1E1JTE1_9HELO|nr:uncharacterized protein RCO7_04702 [Rhynchosporium commune]
MSFQDKSFYDTLSYRWVSLDSTKLIEVDIIPASVTVNLYAALLRFRCKDNNRTNDMDRPDLYDQQNTEEKTIQVRLMRELYTNCNQFLVWIEEIADGISRVDAKSILEVLCSISNDNLPTPACVASAATFRGPNYALKSIGVDDHPWWERVWTAQEAILPAKKTFL